MTRSALRATDGLATLLTRPGGTEEARDTDNQPTRAIASRLGHVTMDTTAAVMAGDRERVVTGSADFLEALLAVWEDQGVDPQTVWSELYARIEMGELSLKLSRAPGRRRTARHGPWRVATSKLP